MTALQIIAIIILSLGALVACGFAIAFIVVSCPKKEEEPEVVQEESEEVSEIDLDLMLAKLEEATKNNKKEEVVEEKTEVEIIEEQPVEEAVAEEETVEETAEEVVEEVKAEETAEQVEETSVEEAQKAEPEFDYRVRLAKIKESQAKIDRDLDKTTRAIVKYERTIRRKERNQKMLDRRALELTNLNLLMYSVTDIKNVDAEKKARQEELTAHIAELKASIQDAENYITANKEKHESNLKLRDYLAHEKTRYADEVKELEDLIASGKFFDDQGEQA